jgi:hypothetical protein
MSRITTDRTDLELKSLASAYAMHPSIEAVVVSGSIGGALADELSDFDIYVYSKSPVEVEFRERLLRPRAVKLNLHRTFWEDEDAWLDATGTKFEAMYRSCSWTEGEIASRIEKHQACIGYTTAILYNIINSTIIFDRSGWFKSIQETLSRGFPVQLVRSIVANNYPLLGEIISSYEEQIASAIRRSDTVSINHRVAAWLASYFDIIFAVNDRFHPGEKRLVSQMAELPDLPEGAIADVQIILSMSTSSHSELSSRLADMREKTRSWLESRRLLTNAQTLVQH